jgi:hypothetical protein
MTSKKPTLAVLVHSCDRYAFLYKGFEFFFAKYWNVDIDCKCYFATEELAVSLPNFENIRSGKGEWADRLAFLLKEKITEPYVLYLQEDMWFTKPINAVFFNQLAELASKNNWQQVKLHSFDRYKTTATDVFIEGFNVAKIDNKASEYLMSHQATLWNKDFLLKQLHKGEHPWRNERKGTQRLKKLNPDIYHVDYFAESGNNENNLNHNPIQRSAYYTVSMNSVLNDNIHRFIPVLAKTDEIYQQYATQLQYHYDKNITHDGKPKPRKDDIVKRIKNWLNL